jgi:heat shock protein HslJ
MFIPLFFLMKISYFFSVLVAIFGSLLLNISPVGAQNNQIACTMEYAPVCGSVQVQCITAPCNPIKQTFSNSCMASASNATNVTIGECGDVAPPIVGGDTDIHGCKASAGYSWSIGENKCIRPWEAPKMTPRAALQDGIWIIESLNGKAIQSSGSITFGKNTFSAKLCNTINGQYGTLAGTLMLRKVMSTRMYCDSDIMKVEDAWSFSRAKFMVWSTQLTVTTKQGDVIVWKKK